jgi:hypothetical protein
MNRWIYIASLVVTLLSSRGYINAQEVTLTSDVLAVIDGNIITADVIEFIRKIRAKIINFVLGDLVEAKRIGRYVHEDDHYNIHDLLMCELDDQLSLPSLFIDRAKNDFLAIIKELLESARPAKKIFNILIIEECEKRNRPDSLLLKWIGVDAQEEQKMFCSHVKSFATLYDFCVDTLHFLMDLTNSCPKAKKQFGQRVNKWSRLKELVPSMLKESGADANNLKIAFLRYVKHKYLDILGIEDITKEKIKEILDEFIAQTKLCSSKNS